MFLPKAAATLPARGSTSTKSHRLMFTFGFLDSMEGGARPDVPCSVLLSSPSPVRSRLLASWARQGMSRARMWRDSEVPHPGCSWPAMPSGRVCWWASCCRAREDVLALGLLPGMMQRKAFFGAAVLGDALLPAQRRGWRSINPTLRQLVGSLLYISVREERMLHLRAVVGSKALVALRF